MQGLGSDLGPPAGKEMRQPFENSAKPAGLRRCVRVMGMVASIRGTNVLLDWHGVYPNQPAFRTKTLPERPLSGNIKEPVFQILVENFAVALTQIADRTCDRTHRYSGRRKGVD